MALGIKVGVGAGRGSGRGGSAFEAPPISSLALIPGLRAWYGDAATTSAGKASQWTDLSGNGKHLTQGTGARQPSFDATSLDVNAAPAMRFLREDNQYLDGATAADWSFLHDMVGGCTVAMWVIADRQDAGEGAILDTTSGTSAAGGFGFWFLGNTDTARFLVMNGATTIIAASVTVQNAVPALLVFRCDAAGNYTVRKNGIQVASGVRSTNPVETPPSRPLRVGNFQDAIAYSVPSTCIVPSIAMWARPLTDDETRKAERYMEARFRVSTLNLGTDRILPALSGTVRLLCTGDSITLGTGAVGLTGGWRNRLNTLSSGFPGFTLQAVGPLNNGGFGGMGDAHNGRSGWTIRGNAHSYTASGHMPGSIPGNAGELDEVLTTYDPHVHVILLGTNDVSTDPENVYCNSSAANWEALVRYAYARKPNARLVLCSITPTNIATRYWDRERQYNRGIRLAMARLHADGISFVFCDANAAIDPATGISGDTVHPNDVGYTALGDVIWPAIRRAAGHL
jgi:lysophospholipase L1-like esterase